jgi:predicted  nucleic acid-binding Zn-ribbon protein
MTDNIAGMIAAATAVIGFVAVWIRAGNRLGKNENTLETLKEQMGKAEGRIAALEAETVSIQVSIAGTLGEIKAKLDSLRETVATLKGGRRAAEKQD